MPANADRTHVVSLTVPAEPKWLALCRLVLAGVCRLGPIDEETLADLKLAVTEACSNSVRHAYQEGGGLVRVRYELTGEALSVEVADAGRGFRFDRPVRELGPGPDEEPREDEMGLAIIHALVDEVEIGAGPAGDGTTIGFRKLLGAAANGSAGSAG
ncbi:MAG TPA: ATP-binding protein [Gaiellaceae bacterium]|nr:ATP-binding protein [Gaiellaceae bacterium]